MPLKVKGAEALTKKLDSLGRKLASKGQRAAARAAGPPMVKAIKPHVPVDSGQLKKAMNYKAAGRGMMVKTIIGADVDKLKSDESRPSNIDWLVEFGHVSADGAFTPPQPFLRTAAPDALAAGEGVYAAKIKAFIEANT